MDSTINSIITSLNYLGEVFCDHATGMLLQSSVLICILVIVNLLLRKHVKAVWRYCLWMILFVKLVLPPSFASPTGIAYWLEDGDRDPAVVSPLPDEPAATVAVSFPAAEQYSGAAATPSLSSATVPEPTRSAVATVHKLESLNLQAVLLLCWAAGIVLRGVDG